MRKRETHIFVLFAHCIALLLMTRVVHPLVVHVGMERSAAKVAQ